MIKSISVFCGSSPGTEEGYRLAAKELGKLLAKRDIRLIYGGSDLGLMGEISQSVIINGGKVTGVMPKIFVGKVAHPELDKLIIVDTMHERKAKMFELSDAFIALPGGVGTFEEILEIITWAQLGIHSKPCGILNVCGYYDKLIEFLEHSVKQRFMKKENQEMLLVDVDPISLLDRFNNYKSSNIDKWLDRK